MLKNIVNIENLKAIYDFEVSINVKNKKRIYDFDKYKMEYLLLMQSMLLDGSYYGGRYNLFIIKKPKLRLIMSQNIFDKTINHFVTRYILEPKLTKYLDIRNCATRKNMGTSYAINLSKKYLNVNKKHDSIYALKIDIKKYFYNIDHEILKQLLINDLDSDEYHLMCKIIDSTDSPYINRKIQELNDSFDKELPFYIKGKGLPIGNLSSQFLAIFYLNKLQHYIINDLHLKFMINYMDDYIILSHDKEYLKKCQKIIEQKLLEEYKLEVNKNKTYIRNLKYGVTFLGYTFRVIDNKTIIKISSGVKKKLKHNLKKLSKESDNFSKYFSSIMNYKYSYIYANYFEIEKIINEFVEYLY
jgi:RNA-directed DNA polymerase